MRTRGTAILLLGLLLLVAGAACSRSFEQPGDSRLLVPRITDPDPSVRVERDKGSYIEKLPR